MTPLGHASISYLLSRVTTRLSLAALLLGGLLPDIDYLFVFAPWFNVIHRAVTHNLLFVFLTAAIGFFITPKDRRISIFIGLALGGVFHLFADSIIDSNPSNGIGVAIFWPFHSGYYFSPLNLVNLYSSIDLRQEHNISIRGVLLSIPWETPLYVGAALLLWKRRH